VNFRQGRLTFQTYPATLWE